MFTTNEVMALNISQELKAYLETSATLAATMKNTKARNIVKNSTLQVLKLYQNERNEWVKLFSNNTNTAPAKPQKDTRPGPAKTQTTAANGKPKHVPGFTVKNCSTCPDEEKTERQKEEEKVVLFSKEPQEKKTTAKKRGRPKKKKEDYRPGPTKELSEANSPEEVLDIFGYPKNPPAQIRAQITSIIVTGYGMNEELGKLEKMDLAELAAYLYDLIKAS